MNRLILIGNGFDLAHGLKTSYNHFMVWYLKKAFKAAFDDKKGEFNDDVLKISTRRGPYKFPIHSIKNTDEFIDLFYHEKGGFSSIIDKDEIQIPKPNSNGRLNAGTQTMSNPFHVVVKTSLMDTLLRTCSYSNWVDIENEFYEQLKKILNGQPDPKKKSKEAQLLLINTTLKTIVSELRKYMQELPTAQNVHKYNHIFNSNIYKDDIVTDKLENDTPPDDTLILNFNYTKTAERYIKKSPNKLKPEVVYIHGELNNDNNPLIFGFGDELDENYKKMESEKTKGFFEYIKSFWYFKTSNYHKLTRFIEDIDFQVVILGHSCGLSDRTMLNMIFEHPHCKSIKIYYFEDAEKTNNFRDLTQEISRHFTNKGEMRKKITPFDRSNPMPQAVAV